VRVTAIETIAPADAYPPFFFVHVHTDEGITGLGQTADLRTIEVVHDLAQRYVIGNDPLRIEELWTRQFEYAAYHGYGGAELRAISAIDIALWDILGQVTGQPIYQLLGGSYRDQIRVYNTCSRFRDRSDGQLAHDDPRRLVDELLAMNITCLKTAPWDTYHRHNRGQPLTPEQLREGIAFYEAIARAGDGRMEIMADLHGLWNLTNAITLAHALEASGLPIHWLEDPLWQETPDAWAELRHATSLRIAGSERLFTRFQMRPLLEAHGTDVMIGDVTWTGGISEVKKMATMAETYSIPFAPHDHSGPVNLWASAHVLLTIPNAYLMETTRVFYEGYYDELVEGETILANGHMHLPRGAGLGIRLRPGLLARDGTTVRRSDESDVPPPRPLGGIH
jgi:L-alanine-DL-glutamate epimerase-like enolase superfamily enzyme